MSIYSGKFYAVDKVDLRLSDRIALCNHDRIGQIGNGQDLYNHLLTRFSTPVMASSNFLRSEAVNLWNGKAVARFPDGTVIADVPVALYPAGKS